MWQALTETLNESRRPQHTRRATILLVVVAILYALLDIMIIGHDHPAPGVGVNLAMQLLVDCSLVLLLRFPKAVTVIALAVSLAMLGFDLAAPGYLAPLNTISLITMPRAVPVVIIVAVLIGPPRFGLMAVGIFTVVGARLWHPTWAVTPFGLLSTLAPALGSLYFDARKQLMQSLRDRAERAERERELLAEQARAEERRRLAAEMHDVVTHRISLMVLHAGALRLTSQDRAVQDAAEDIRESGAHALQELRDLVGVLRREDLVPIKEPATSEAGDIAALLAESESVGVPVELDADGDATQASPTVARTVYRVVQEALTNVRKHAPGARARVRLRYDECGVEVSVTNSAPERSPDPALAGSGGGVGLAGLRQRVELVGGSLTSGPTNGGGFALSAILPAYVTTTESR